MGGGGGGRQGCMQNWGGWFIWGGVDDSEKKGDGVHHYIHYCLELCIKEVYFPIWWDRNILIELFI